MNLVTRGIVGGPQYPVVVASKWKFVGKVDKKLNGAAAFHTRRQTEITRTRLLILARVFQLGKLYLHQLAFILTVKVKATGEKLRFDLRLFLLKDNEYFWHFFFYGEA